MLLLNCTSVIVADIIISGKSDVINVADNYISTINVSIGEIFQTFQSGVMLLIINMYTLFFTSYLMGFM